jgi:hypothetical protein
MSNNVFASLFISVIIAGISDGFAEHRVPGRIRGVAVRIDQTIPIADIEKSLSEIRSLRADTVLIKIEEIQDHWDSSFVYPDPEITIPLRTLTASLIAARQNGLKVCLMPIVLIKYPRTKKDWRGMIAPKDQNAWLQSYRAMIVKYSQIAQESGVDFFSIGSEMVSMERHWEFWKNLVDDVRMKFTGHVLYSANWDHMVLSPAWKELDVIAINAYFELASRNESPTVSELVSRWERVVPRIVTWSGEIGKPLLLSEVGYPSRKGGLSDPWDHTIRSGSSDESLQANGYRAVLKAWKNRPNLLGLIFYEWYDPKLKGETGYTPKGKSGETILKKWFAESH